MKFSFKLLVAVSLPALILSCASNPLELRPISSFQPKPIQGFECRSPILVIDGRRSNTEYHKMISRDDAIGWLRTNLQAISSNDLVFVGENEEAVDALSIELRHAYISHKVSNKIGVVSIRAHHNGYQESFRAHSARINWFGSKDEYIHQLNAVMIEALRKFAYSPNFCNQ